MLIESRAVAPFFKNGFLVVCPSSKRGVLIDPGDEVPQLLELAGRLDVTIEHILLTHAHMDHVAGVKAAKAATGAPVWVHREDLFLYEAAVEQGQFFGYELEEPPAPDRFYEPPQQITVGAVEIAVHHTPGHSPGGVCLAARDGAGGDVELFVGDTLFAGSIGRTDLPGGDYDTLLGSIGRVLFPFGDGATVHPGHGPDTTIGDERRTNPFLRRL
jgi:glyoxylase-like metal-dependent hydrolase (beta-lactamase superfamily II)